MARPRKHQIKGLTLIEVMISMLVSLVIVIGVMSYMYSTASNARAADVRITAARLGQMLLDAWKTNITIVKIDGEDVGIWNVETFNPMDESFKSNLPAVIATTDIGDSGVVGGTELQKYRIYIDGANFFATLSYRDGEDESNGTGQLLLLNVCMAWNRNYSSSELDDYSRNISLSSYSLYKNTDL